MRSVPIAFSSSTTSSLLASRLGLGTSGLHHLLTSAKRQNLLQAAYDAGIRYFDTAPLYGHEMAERELGLFASRLLTQHGDPIVIASKIGIRPHPLFCKIPLLMYGQAGLSKVKRKIAPGLPAAITPTRDYSAAYLRQRVERSLRLLRRDALDILYLHEPTLAQLQQPDELVRTLENLRQAGKIRAAGISGSVQDSAQIIASYPALGEVLQLDLSGPASLNIPVHASFGHFRGKGLSALAGKEAAGARQQLLQNLLASAVQQNPDGVILFSSVNAAHIGEVVAALAVVEPHQVQTAA